MELGSLNSRDLEKIILVSHVSWKSPNSRDLWNVILVSQVIFSNLRDPMYVQMNDLIRPTVMYIFYPCRLFILKDHFNGWAKKWGISKAHVDHTIESSEIENLPLKTFWGINILDVTDFLAHDVK